MFLAQGHNAVTPLRLEHNCIVSEYVTCINVLYHFSSCMIMINDLHVYLTAKETHILHIWYIV